MKKGLVLVLGLVLVVGMSGGVSSYENYRLIRIVSYLGDMYIDVRGEDVMGFGQDEISFLLEDWEDELNLTMNALQLQAYQSLIKKTSPMPEKKEQRYFSSWYLGDSIVLNGESYEGFVSGNEEYCCDRWYPEYNRSMKEWRIDMILNFVSEHKELTGTLSTWLVYDEIENEFIEEESSFTLNVILKEETYSAQISTLESWKQSISLTIQAIETQLKSIKQWLFFWDYQGEEENICNVIENECGGAIPCTDECTQGSTGCTDENTKWTCQLQNDGCYDKISVDCNQGETCEDGECIPPSLREVIFRTNVMNGNYYGCTLTTNCWIAVDFDSDGDLEAMGFDGKSTSCRTGTTVVNTPEGYPVINYGSTSKLAICDSNKKESRFSIARIPKNPELSKNPTEPYASNNQEVYSTVALSDSSSGGGGGGSLVNVSVNIKSGTLT